MLNINSLREILSLGSLLNPDTGCIEWIRAKGSNGYGQIRIGERVVYVHRAAWEVANGPIPDGLHVLHKCDNRLCGNVGHLFLGSNADNVIDKCRKGRQLNGERHGRSRLTEEQIRRIRVDSRTQRAIASEYRVSQKQISRIKRVETWSHVA